MFGKQYRQLMSAIKNNMNLEDANFLCEYLTDIKNGVRKNDFYDEEFLTAIIQSFTSHDRSLDDISAEEELNEIISEMKVLLPLGKNTENYEKIKSLIIVGNGHINKDLYTLFDNAFDYHQVMSLMKDFDKKTQEYVSSFLLKISPLCNSNDEIKRYALSYISSIKNEDKLDEERIIEIGNDILDEAKRKNGIYSLDEKKLAKIDAMVRKAESYARKFDDMEKRVQGYKDTIDFKTKEGIKEINEIVVNAKSTLITELNNYLVELEKMLKESSDQAFNEILKRAQEKIEDIKLIAYNINTTTTSELLRIQKMSEESIEKLQDYVENDEQLQKALVSATKNEGTKKAFLSMFGDKTSGVKETNSDTKVTFVAEPNAVIIPGNDRLIVPSSPDIVLPPNINNKIIRAFDSSIPYSKREEEILKEKERREKEEGIIYHEMTDEIIKCLLEGDWPYLYGPSGCGKSYLIDQVASLIGLDVIENGKITEKYSVMGYNDAHGRFKATQAFMALVYGKLLSLDEFDNGNPDTQVVLNTLYSELLRKIENPSKERYVTFGEDMKVPVNPNFRMIAAGNTDGQGRNEVYQARGKIDESVQQRMTPKEFRYDNKIEQRILGENKNWYNLFTKFREVCDSYAKEVSLTSTPGIVTTRDASAIKKYIDHNSKTVDQILREKFVQVKDEEYLSYIIDKFKRMYDITGSIDKMPTSNKDKSSSVDEKTLVKSLIYACDERKKRL